MNERRTIEARVEWADGERKAFLVGEWPERADWDGALLRDPDKQNIVIDDETIIVTFENASARYRIGRYDWGMDRYESTLLVSDSGERAEV